MIPIFICEDDPKQKEKLEKIITDQIMIEELNMQLVCSTENPYIILEQMPRHEAALYFLDIDLNCDIDGIELATQIRKRDPSAKIVFVTTHGELATSIFKYKIEALDYIVKDQTSVEVKNKVIECMHVTQERYFDAKNDPSTAPYLTLKINGKMHFIPIQDIMFFETSTIRNRLDLHLENRMLQFRGTLKEIEERSPLFIRSHHTIIVNKQNISSVDQKRMMLEMINGESCVLSVRGLKELKKQIENESHLFES